MTRLRMKFLREQLGLRQQDVADKLHVAQSTLSEWESGTHAIDFNSLYALATLYDTSIDYLLGYSAIRSVNPGKPEHLLLEFLLAKYGIRPGGKQRKAIEVVIDAIVEFTRMK